MLHKGNFDEPWRPTSTCWWSSGEVSSSSIRPASPGGHRGDGNEAGTEEGPGHQGGLGDGGDWRMGTQVPLPQCFLPLSGPARWVGAPKGVSGLPLDALTSIPWRGPSVSGNSSQRDLLSASLRSPRPGGIPSVPS